MSFVDWSRSPDDPDLADVVPRSQPFGDERTAWLPGPGRTLDDVANTLDIPAEWDVAEVDPHAGDLIDTSAESAPTVEDGPQPWE